MLNYKDKYVNEYTSYNHSDNYAFHNAINFVKECYMKIREGHLQN